MPTYEYKCPAGHVFEKYYPTMNDNRRVRCPTCGKAAERQISGGAGLVFRGSGFYATDYKRAGETKEGDQKKEGEKKEGEKKEGEKEGEKKAESKAHSKKHSKDK
jgi:putative FmdB family regulatory protein